jgi:hypothetical protein
VQTPSRKYQKTDAAVVDYGYQVLEGCSFAVRGPLPLSPDGRNILCLGSAATFGRFARQPFPARVAARLGVNVVNLGFGGARPETYLKEPATLQLCRQSDLVILELMSARSYASDLFQPLNHLTGLGKLGPKYAKMIRKLKPNSPLLEEDVFVNRVGGWAAKNLGWEELNDLKRQLLANYRRDAIQLICEIGRPVLLLWLSQRSMDQIAEPGSRISWDCGFPHFVDRETVEAIRAHAIGLVEVESKLGVPSTLTSMATGELAAVLRGPTPHLNSYYPSPEMHEQAALQISDFLTQFLV